MRGYSITLLVGIIFLCSVDPGFATGGEEYPRITARVDPSEVTIGVPVEYTVRISGKVIDSLRVQPPSQGEYYPPGEEKKDSRISSLLPLYIVRSSRRDVNRGADPSVTVTVKLVYYRPGTYQLPAVGISEGADRIGYRLPEITVKGVNVKGEFQEIEPPLELGGNYCRLILLVLGILALVALILFLVHRLRRRERRVEEVPPPPPIEIFLNEIASLEKRRLIESGRYEEFAVCLSSHFRVFLTAQFGFDALEMTASEIIRSLRKRVGETPFGKHRTLQSLLELWDLIKFAEFIPMPETLFANCAKTKDLAKELSSLKRHNQREGATYVRV
jgi:hypothetical protein